MNATKYQIFLKTVECGSFTKAAADLNFSQSGISHAINSLEEELGVTLLSRNRGGVTLTGDGRALLPQIQQLCDEAIANHTASVCINTCYVKQAVEYMAGRIPVCCVVGFPLGAMDTASKAFEAKTAIENGAAEVDMVINIGWVKDGLYDRVLDEIRAVKAHCQGRLLKVIIETCMLTDAEKIEMCRVVSQSGAEYIKTSTGFGGGGATREDVALFKAHVAPHVKIKAAGGIANLDDARDFVALGADRLGTSRIVKAVKAMEQE